MAAGRNYLLGRGENLTSDIPPPGGGGPKAAIYSLDEARGALAPRAVDAARALDELPPAACPGDLAVAALTLHPAYLAKSHFPAGLLDAVGLRAVGSRPVTVVPRRPPRSLQPGVRAETAALFVAGPRSHFRALPALFERVIESDPAAGDVIKIEDFRVVDAAEKVRPIRGAAAEPLLEVVLHGAGLSGDLVLDGFRHYLVTLGLDVDLDRRLEVGPLFFLPLRAPRDFVERVARYSFLRLAREMPALRRSRPEFRVVAPGVGSFPCRLPEAAPRSPEVRVAVCDGGLPAAPDLGRWVRRFDAPGVGAPDPDDLEHGLAVTSALLFGPLDPDGPADGPYAPVDHHRVLDAAAAADPQGQLYPVLERIAGVLERGDYGFVNLSLGPDLPIEDDDVTAWTARLDPLLAHGGTLATIAAGNGGGRDAEAGMNRVQAPADCVNGLAVGACDSPGMPWDRAAYSSVGPGRSPGRIKPDVLGFGGTARRPSGPSGRAGDRASSRSRGPASRRRRCCGRRSPSASISGRCSPRWRSGRCWSTEAKIIFYTHTTTLNTATAACPRTSRPC